MTKNPKYKSEIKFGDYGIDVDITYQTLLTEENAQALKEHYARRFSKKHNKNVEPREIKLNQEAGDLVEETIFARFKIDEPIYVGFHFLKEKAPYVIPSLIKDLMELSGKNDLSRYHKETLDHAIKELERVQKSKSEVKIERVFEYDIDPTQDEK